jgi:hypothetical protein
MDARNMLNSCLEHALMFKEFSIDEIIIDDQLKSKSLWIHLPTCLEILKHLDNLFFVKDRQIQVILKVNY